MREVNESIIVACENNKMTTMYSTVKLWYLIAKQTKKCMTIDEYIHKLSARLRTIDDHGHGRNHYDDDGDSTYRLTK